MKRALKWFAGILLGVVMLPFLLVVALYIPPIQQWVVQKACHYASQETGMEITIDALHITPLLDIQLDELHVRKLFQEMIGVRSATIDLTLNQLLYKHIVVEDISLEGGNVELDLMQSEEKDTTETSPIPLTIDIQSIALKDLQLCLRSAKDNLYLDADIEEALLNQGDVNLEQGEYKAKQLELKAHRLNYNTFGFKNISAKADNIHFRQSDTYLSANIRQLAFSEKRGIELQHLACNVLMDSTSIHVKGLDLLTSNSSASGNADMDFSAITPHKRGNVKADLKAQIGHEDILALASEYMPQGLAKVYPQQPIILSLNAEGNVDSLCIYDTKLTMPTVIDIRTEGHVTNATDSLHRSANLTWDIHTGNLSFLRTYLGLKDIALPAMSLNADTRLKDMNLITADAHLQEGRGHARLVGDIDLKQMKYDAKLKISNMLLHDFLPHDSIYHLTANAKLSGKGSDFLSPATRVNLQAEVETLEYAKWNLNNISLQGKLRKGDGTLEIDSDNDILRMQACADAILRERKLQASSFSLDMSHIDLHALRIAKDTLSASMVMHMEGASDFRQTHRLMARAEAMELVMKDTVFHPVELVMDADLTPEYIHAKANAGDMMMSFESAQGLDSLLAKSDIFLQQLRQQIDSLYIRQDTLQTLLPDVRMRLTAGQRNPLSNILRSTVGYTYSDLHFAFSSNPETGVTGNGYMHRLNTGAVLLDTIDWHIYQEKEGVRMESRIKNGPKNKVVDFESRLQSALTPTGASIHLDFKDAKGKKGVDIGLKADMMEDRVKLHFTPLNPIIAYRNFSINEDNFIELTREGHLRALVDLLADDGTGLKIYSTDNPDAQQDVSLSVNHFNLGELSQVLPYMPEIQGFLHGDFHYMQADSTTTVSADMNVQNMKYQGTGMGNMGLNLVYFPNADGSHYVDGIVSQNDNEILYLSGKYWEQEGDGRIDATASMNQLPFSLADAFIPDGMARLTGFANGDMEVTGRTANPILNGSMQSSNLHILSPAYNIDLRVPDNNIEVNDSRLQLNHLEAYAAGKTPLTLDGNIDFSNLSKVQMTIDIEAKNYQLINAPRTRDALAYGKVFVDLRSRLWGTLDDLKMRGRLGVLGNTDVSYVLKDSPITVQDQLADIVTFVDFSDTIKAEPVEVMNQSIDMQMNISIEPSATVHCILSEDGSDNIDLQGGGDLSLTYDLQNDLQLYGRYTIQQGTMRYSLMAIPLNDFQIASGSYVEFQGNMMNPRLSIKASERVKASVTENSLSRNVTFDVGLALSQTLEDMGLEFTLQAPEDMTVQNELTAMSAEDRGRVAVTMLVTGMYLTNESNIKGGFSYANTLNTYLQSTINNLTSQALNTIDVNVGIENNTTQAGTTTTDYSFSFAKRFWGNRISVIVGGKVSTGRDAVNTGQTIIDNISLEYRLDKNSTRYVRLYYDRNYESLLEGMLMEMGAGLVLRKKTERLGELFIFKKK